MTALNGLRVLDLTLSGPGAYTTMFLGDYGSEVILISPVVEVSSGDKSGGGDGSGSHWTMENQLNILHGAVNRNKKSVAINLRTTEGQGIFHKLAEKADVIVEGFRPGVVSRMKVDYQIIEKINPRIIYCSMSGYGQDGPYRDLAGHDVNYISFAGALDIIGLADGPPVIPMNFLADWAGAGLHAVIGILLAVVAREKTGRGQYIDISYMESVMSLMTVFFHDYLNTGTMYSRGGTWFGGGSPYYNVYETKDGKYFTVGCVEPKFWENLCRALGREDFIPYQYDEGEKRAEIFSSIREIFRSRNRDEWFEFFKDKNIPIGKVYPFNEVLTDPQVCHRRVIEEISKSEKGTVKYIRPTIRLSDTPGGIRNHAPLRGQNTREIMQQLGYSMPDIERLVKAGAIQ